MTTTAQKQQANDRASAKYHHQDNGIPAQRLQNIVQIVADNIRAGTTPIDPASMAETDELFAVDALLQYLKSRAVSGMTKEKSRQQRRLHSKALFLKTLEQDGGAYSSAQAAEILGKTKTTVKTWREAHRLLALDIDGEFYYPVFQFTENEEVSEKGILRGIAELLPKLQHFSDRMQYSFFTENRNTVLDGLTPAGRSFTVAELLRNNPTKEQWAELDRLVRLYGTQDVA
ncbi:helix-turn-helix domain-containing protein [Pectobacterium brasiliense]|uniref:helix-turn-helix domain-containing protein n=1 Tax=Pectobacterium brasiliense TaxID=180957 RepID=UPI0032EDAD55